MLSRFDSCTFRQNEKGGEYGDRVVSVWDTGSVWYPAVCVDGSGLELLVAHLRMDRDCDSIGCGRSGLVVQESVSAEQGLGRVRLMVSQQLRILPMPSGYGGSSPSLSASLVSDSGPRGSRGSRIAGRPQKSR